MSIHLQFLYFSVQINFMG